MWKTLCVVFLLSASVAAAATIQTYDRGPLGTLNVPRTGPWHATTDAVATRDAWGEEAQSFLRRYLAGKGAAGNESLATRRIIHDEKGQVHVRITESIAGLPVVGAEMIVHADAKSGRVLRVNGRFGPSSADLPRRAEVNAGAAIEFAAAEYGIAPNRIEGDPALTYIIDDETDTVRLAWTDLVSYSDEEGQQLDRIYADAITGDAIARHPQIHYAKNRAIYDCNSTTIVPGTLVISEGGSSGDSVAMSAYTNLGITYNYYSTRFGRDSYNNAGATIKANVHYDLNLNNAFWLSPYLYFGDGDGVNFDPLAGSLDVVAHEFTHAVTQSTSGLFGTKEPGALNESMSDIFGAATEAYSDGSVNPDVWKIGDEVYKVRSAIRYMNDPAADNESRDYYPSRYLTGDHVHHNGGIQNLAFYLLVNGGQHPRGKTNFFVTAIGMAAAEKIFYRALDADTITTTNFRQMRDNTLAAATYWYGQYSTQYNAVWNAWAAVGNNWFESIATITAGDTFITEPYTSITSNIHTGQMTGLPGTNFDLYLEKWNGAAWQTEASFVKTSSNETVEYSDTPGQYRWRVYAVSGTGTFHLYENRPR